LPPRNAAKKFASPRHVSCRSQNSKPNPISRAMLFHRDPGIQPRRQAGARIQNQTHSHFRTHSWRAPYLHKPKPKFKTKPNSPPARDGLVQIRRPVKPIFPLGRVRWMDAAWPFRPPAESPSQHPEKKSPIPEVPRFECTGPDPPLRSPPGKSQTGPGVSDTGSWKQNSPSRRSSGPLQANKQTPAESPIINKSNCWPAGRVFISPRSLE
jgi:hypothetical protein